MLRSRLADPTLPPTERAFVDELAPAFTELAETAEDTLYVDGAARLVSEYRFQDVSQLNALMEMLERRVSLLGVLSAALGRARRLRADRRRERRAGAAVAVAGRRQLRAAAAQPRHRVGDRADADGLRAGDPLGARGGLRAVALHRGRLRSGLSMAARLLRGARRRRGTPTRPRSRRRSAGSRASCTRTSTPTTRRRRRSSRRPPRPTRCSRTPSARRTYDAYGHEGLKTGGYSPQLRGLRLDLRTSSARSSAAAASTRAFGGARRAAARCRAATSPSRSTIDLAEAAHGELGRGRLRRDRAVRDLPRQRRRARHADRHLRRCQRRRASSRPSRAPASARSCAPRSATSCGGDGRVAESPCQDLRRARHAGARSGEVEVDIPAGIADGQRIRLTGRGHAGRARRPATATSTWSCGSREDERFIRDGEDLITVVDVAAPLAALGTTIEVPDARRRRAAVDVPAGTQPGETILLRGRGMPPLGRGRTGDLRVVVNVVIPRRLTAEQRDLLERLAGLDRPRTTCARDEGMLAKLKRALAG